MSITESSNVVSVLYFLKQLKRAGVPPQQLLHFYTAVIRLVLEYASQVWHYAINRTQSQHLESIQKRALHIIFNFTHGFSYSSIMFVAGLNSLQDRRHNLSRSFFKAPPNLIPASITSSHLSVIHLSFLDYGPPHLTLAHPHALKIPIIY